MTMNCATFAEVAGWTGTMLLLGAYTLLSIGRLKSGAVLYQLMNVLGALGVAINGWRHGALPGVALNAVWLLVGLAALMQMRCLPAKESGFDIE